MRQSSKIRDLILMVLVAGFLYRGREPRRPGLEAASSPAQPNSRGPAMLAKATQSGETMASAEKNPTVPVDRSRRFAESERARSSGFRSGSARRSGRERRVEFHRGGARSPDKPRRKPRTRSRRSWWRAVFSPNPQVSVFTKEYVTQGVSVMGEVQKPGVYPVLGARKLV